MGGAEIVMVLDTCAILYLFFEPDKLSHTALNKIARSEELIVSSISVFEIGIKLKNKKLKLPLTHSDFVENLLQVDKIQIIPVDEMLWIHAVELPWENRDPADRVIVATAMKLNHAIVTTDAEMRKFYKKTIC